MCEEELFISFCFIYHIFISADWNWFLQNTEGGVMIEGPQCYAELGESLPNRGTIVISRDASKTFPGAITITNLNEAIETADKMDFIGPIWVCGGQRIYNESLPLCSKLYITRIDRDYDGDRFFPEIWKDLFTELEWSRKSFDIDSSTMFTFEIWRSQ